LTEVAATVPPPPGRDSTRIDCPVFSVTFLATKRWKVSELAPGVNGMTTVMGRLDKSSAAACSWPIRLASDRAAIAAATVTIGRPWPACP
jgi:hypothetical protein